MPRGPLWTPAEDAQVLAAQGRYGALRAVAERIGRTAGSVRTRAHTLRQAAPASSGSAQGHDPGIEEHAPAASGSAHLETAPASTGPGERSPTAEELDRWGLTAEQFARRGLAPEEFERNVEHIARTLAAEGYGEGMAPERLRRIVAQGIAKPRPF